MLRRCPSCLRLQFVSDRHARRRVYRSHNAWPELPTAAIPGPSCAQSRTRCGYLVFRLLRPASKRRSSPQVGSRNRDTFARCEHLPNRPRTAKGHRSSGAQGKRGSWHCARIHLSGDSHHSVPIATTARAPDTNRPSSRYPLRAVPRVQSPALRAPSAHRWRISNRDPVCRSRIR